MSVAGRFTVGFTVRFTVIVGTIVLGFVDTMMVITLWLARAPAKRWKITSSNLNTGPCLPKGWTAIISAGVYIGTRACVTLSWVKAIALIARITLVIHYSIFKQ